MSPFNRNSSRCRIPFYSKDVPTTLYVPYSRSVERTDLIFSILFVCVYVCVSVSVCLCLCLCVCKEGHFPPAQMAPCSSGGGRLSDIRVHLLEAE